MKPIRIGIMLWSLPGDDWADKVKRIEELGYSSLLIPDHPNLQWDSVATQTAIAVTTEKLNVGSFVFNIDFHHPVMLAKASATIQNISRGRHEFGIGAGWSKVEYEHAGIFFDKPGIRISRLGEAIQVIQSMWVNERTSFEGAHFKISNQPQAASDMKWGQPKTLMGVGGKKSLSLAGRYADIISIIPQDVDFTEHLTPKRLKEKISWVQIAAEKAGRDLEEIEYNFNYFPGMAITDDPKPILKQIAKDYGLTVEEVKQNPNFFVGNLSEFREDIEERYKTTGINYYAIPGFLSNFEEIEEIGSIIKKLGNL